MYIHMYINLIYDVKIGHLKRFTRGIAELMEVSKSAPHTPVPTMPTPNVNGFTQSPTYELTATPPAPPPVNGEPHTSRDSTDGKTSEAIEQSPPKAPKPDIAPRKKSLQNSPQLSPRGSPRGSPRKFAQKSPQGSPNRSPVSPRRSPHGSPKQSPRHMLPKPKLSPKPVRKLQEEAAMMNRLNSNGSRSRSNSGEQSQQQDSVSSSFNKMKNIMEMKMGSGPSTESLENSMESETSKTSRSPSHSPQIQRKGPQGSAAPPPPRRAPQTSLSAVQRGDSLAAQNRQSLSSSASSLSSNFSERTTGSYDVGVSRPPPAEMPTQQEIPPKLPAKKKKQSVPVVTKPSRGMYCIRKWGQNDKRCIHVSIC